jgi:tripartite-type tricarboxylate transporter receptor subunit TctC
LQDVLGGTIPLVYTAVAGAAPHIKSGKLVPIAVSSETRDAALPQVPTMKEVGFPDMVANSWVAVLAPAKTPKAIVDKLQKEIAAAMAEPAVKERLLALGITPVGNSPEAFAAQLRADSARYAGVVKDAGIKAE